MKQSVIFCLLALAGFVNGHAQQRIEELIKNAQANNADIEITITTNRNPKSLKIESEDKYIVIKDKALSTQLKEAFKAMSEQAVTFEQRTKKDTEQYTLTFKPANAETIRCDLRIREKPSNAILQIEKKVKP